MHLYIIRCHYVLIVLLPICALNLLKGPSDTCVLSVIGPQACDTKQLSNVGYLQEFKKKRQHIYRQDLYLVLGKYLEILQAMHQDEIISIGQNTALILSSVWYQAANSASAHLMYNTSSCKGQFSIFLHCTDCSPKGIYIWCAFNCILQVTPGYLDHAAILYLSRQ